MSTTTRKTKKAAEAVLPNQTTISPDRIYGFLEAVQNFERSGAYEMPSHPDYLNPRAVRGEASQEVVEAVRESKRIIVPVLVMDVAGEIVLVDGRNRLLGVAAARVDDPTAFPDVPVAIFTANSRQDALIQMAVVNINRENLDEMSLARLLRTLHEGSDETPGMPVDDLADLIGKPNKGGKRKVNQLLDLAGSETLVKAVEKGDITPHVAEQIATRFQDEEERSAAVERTTQVADKIVAEAAAEGKKIDRDEAVTKAAKVSKATRVNRTALSMPDLMHRITQGLKELMEYYPAEYAAWIEQIQDESIADKDIDSSWYTEYLEATAVTSRVLTLAEAAQLAVQTIDYSDPTAMAGATIRRILENLEPRALKQVLPAKAQDQA